MNENQAPKAPTPAADPALGAVEWLADVAENTSAFGVLRRDVLNRTVIIRDALADRITPAEARMTLAWAEAATGEPWHDHAERTLIARLGRIADRETGR